MLQKQSSYNLLYRITTLGIYNSLWPYIIKTLEYEKKLNLILLYTNAAYYSLHIGEMIKTGLDIPFFDVNKRPKNPTNEVPLH